MKKKTKQVDETTTLRKPKIEETKDTKDLYFLDEVIKSMYDNHIGLSNGEFYCVALQDWYCELYKKVNHSDIERRKYLIAMFGQEWVDDEHFLSVDERDLFLENDL